MRLEEWVIVLLCALMLELALLPFIMALLYG